MNTKMPQPQSSFGFLTTLEDQTHGYFGGLLVISERGIPLEFHCSTPVKPSKAQEILYGATLRSYVLGELIGQALLKQIQAEFEVLLTDQAEMLELELLIPQPVALIEKKAAATNSSAEGLPGEAPVLASETPFPQIELNRFLIRGSVSSNWTVQSIQSALAKLVTYVELDEPFERIHEAIREAQRISKDTTSEAEAA